MSSPENPAKNGQKVVLWGYVVAILSPFLQYILVLKRAVPIVEWLSL